MFKSALNVVQLFTALNVVNVTVTSLSLGDSARTVDTVSSGTVHTIAYSVVCTVLCTPVFTISRYRSERVFLRRRRDFFCGTVSRVQSRRPREVEFLRRRRPSSSGALHPLT